MRTTVKDGERWVLTHTRLAPAGPTGSHLCGTQSDVGYNEASRRDHATSHSTGRGNLPSTVPSERGGSASIARTQRTHRLTLGTKYPLWTQGTSPRIEADVGPTPANLVQLSNDQFRTRVRQPQGDFEAISTRFPAKPQKVSTSPRLHGDYK